MNRIREPIADGLVPLLQSLYLPKSKAEKFAKLMEMAKHGDVREYWRI